MSGREMSGQWPPERDDGFPGQGDEHGNEPADELDATAEARLSEVTAFLAAVPVPALPPDVEARIGAALAAEAAARAVSSVSADATIAGAPSDANAAEPDAGEPAGAEESTAAAEGARVDGAVRARTRQSGPAGSGPAGSGPAGSGPARGRVRARRRFRPVATTVPVLVCVLLAGFMFLLSRGGSSSSSSSAASSAGSAAAPMAAPAASAAGSAAAPGPAVPAAGNRAPSAGGAGGTPAAASFLVTSTGTRYQRATLAGQVRARLAAPAPTGSTPAGSSPNAGPSASSGGSPAGRTGVPSAQLRGCVLQLTGGALPRLVDRATYQGEPAYVIASSSRVWVVGLGCTAAKSELVTSVPLAG